jgi:hypothetical protein
MKVTVQGTKIKIDRAQSGQAQSQYNQQTKVTYNKHRQQEQVTDRKNQNNNNNNNNQAIGGLGNNRGKQTTLQAKPISVSEGGKGPESVQYQFKYQQGKLIVNKQ